MKNAHPLFGHGAQQQRIGCGGRVMTRRYEPVRYTDRGQVFAGMREMRPDADPRLGYVFAADYDALEAELDAAKRNRDYWMETAHQAQEHRDEANAQLAIAETERDALRARLAEAERDAARYRWMMEKAQPHQWNDLAYCKTKAEADECIAAFLTPADQPTVRADK
jgi:hypothetical protein